MYIYIYYVWIPIAFIIFHLFCFPWLQVASSSRSAQIWAQRKVEQLSQAQLCDMLTSLHPKQLVEDEVRCPNVPSETLGEP